MNTSSSAETPVSRWMPTGMPRPSSTTVTTPSASSVTSISVAEPGQRLVDRVVDHLPDQVVERAACWCRRCTCPGACARARGPRGPGSAFRRARAPPWLFRREDYARLRTGPGRQRTRMPSAIHFLPEKGTRRQRSYAGGCAASSHCFEPARGPVPPRRRRRTPPDRTSRPAHRRPLPAARLRREPRRRRGSRARLGADAVVAVDDRNGGLRMVGRLNGYLTPASKADAAGRRVRLRAREPARPSG